MQEVVINFWSVFIAGIFGIALGSFWYSPAGFGKQWMKLSGITPEKIAKDKTKGMGKLYALQFVASLVMAWVLAYVIQYAEAQTWWDGAVAGFWTWLGFVATVTLGGVLWEGKSWQLYILNNAYNLVALAVMGVILVAWK